MINYRAAFNATIAMIVLSAVLVLAFYFKFFMMLFCFMGIYIAVVVIWLCFYSEFANNIEQEKLKDEERKNSA
jgi:predicted membrane protein